MDELVEDDASIPSGTLKKNFLALLVSNKRSVKVLANVLQIDPVLELVNNYEECHGLVSLDTWKYVLQQLGYSEHFQRLVLADQMISDATDVAGIDLEDENNCGTHIIARDYWPKWSLPPSDEHLLKENVTENAGKGDDDHFSLQAAAENGPSHENNRIPSTVQSLSQRKNSPPSLVPVIEKRRRQLENFAQADDEIEGREENLVASSVQSDYKQQSIENLTTTPSRPITPEAPCSTHDSVVTGQHRSCQDNAVAKAHHLGNGEQNMEYSDKKSGKTPAENDCIAGNDYIENNNGLYAEFQKENESLHLSVSYLVEKLRMKDSDLARLQTEYSGLQQQLEECEGHCTQLQISNEEFRRRLEESAELEIESQQLIRMTQEVCIWREQENNRLEEHIRQLDQRHDNATRCMEDLRTENQELCEDIQLVSNQVQELQAERDYNLQREREQLRLQFAKVDRAFNNAETDKVKRLKQKLAREKSKRKTLLEKNHQLEELVKELKSKEEGHFPSCEGDVQENSESSSNASSEVEDYDQPGSSNCTKLSDSDSSSEDFRWEDVTSEDTES